MTALEHGYYKLWIGNALYTVQMITCLEVNSGGATHQGHHKSYAGFLWSWVV